jgi:hypothetical protein
VSDIIEGWYIPEPREGRRQIPRRVLGVIAERVRYGTGGGNAPDVHHQNIRDLDS